MSRKRDGIVVSALSFLPPSLVRELIKELLFMVVRPHIRRTQKLFQVVAPQAQ
jgi:hypothetical protein